VNANAAGAFKIGAIAAAVAAGLIYAAAVGAFAVLASAVVVSAGRAVGDADASNAARVLGAAAAWTAVEPGRTARCADGLSQPKGPAAGPVLSADIVLAARLTALAARHVRLDWRGRRLLPVRPTGFARFTIRSRPAAAAGR
jgi:hypothetical protein